MNGLTAPPTNRMKRTLFIIVLIAFGCLAVTAQRNRTIVKTPKPVQGNVAIIADERLSVMRKEPGLREPFIKRLRRGTRITVFENKDADGVTFYRIADPTAASGWIQGQAFAGTFRKGDDLRLMSLVLNSDGYTKIHRGAIFLDLFKDSQLRPFMLVIFGDSIEVAADEISERASAELIRREMAVTRAPVHSFYLNFYELDEYRRLGIKFAFNANTLKLHYNGASWFEVLERYPESEQSIQARERVASLKEKMERKAAK